MFLLGVTSCCGNYNTDPTPVHTEHITSTKTGNCVQDDLFLTLEVLPNPDAEVDRTWNDDTILHCSFNADAYNEPTHRFRAGNVKYLVSDVTSIRIKRREVGTYEWTTLFDIPVNSAEDVNVHKYDYYAKAGVTYEYAVLPILNNTEGIPEKRTVKSDFDGLFICGKERAYSTVLEPSVTEQRNHSSATINTIGSRYPFVIYATKQNYDSGTASGIFAVFDHASCDWDFQNSHVYRKQFIDFLTDGTAKVLKLSDGRAWMIGRVDEVSSEEGDDPDLMTVSFSWEEIGNLDSAYDLYQAGLIDVDATGW